MSGGSALSSQASVVFAGLVVVPPKKDCCQTQAGLREKLNKQMAKEREEVIIFSIIHSQGRDDA